MMTIECDNCEVPFEIDPDQEDDRVACPKCGDINRIPHVNDDLPSGDDPEEDIVIVRPAMFRARPGQCMAIMILLLGGATGAIWSATNEMQWAVWAGGILAAIGAVWWAFWYIVHLGKRIRVTNKRTIYRQGLLSRHTSEVLHNHIRNLQINQSAFQRVLNVGDVTLDSAATGGATGAEIRVSNVPRPRELKEIIDQYRSF